MREIFLLSEDFISRMSVTGVWGQCPRSKSEQSSRDDNNLVRLGWAVFYPAVPGLSLQALPHGCLQYEVGTSINCKKMM
jgi:hypothetical protein